MRNRVFRIVRPSDIARLSRRLLVSAFAALLLSWPLTTGVRAAAGDLDPTFGSGGKITTDFSNSVDSGNATAIQSDGKIVVAGSTIINISTQHDFALARYNHDGSLDASFGSGGKVRTDFSGLGDEAFAIAIQNDGKIIAGGISGIGTSDVIGTSNPDFALARYNTDGTLDPGFGIGGKTTTDFFGFKDQIFAIAIQNDGKILAVGYASFFSKFGVARYNSDGSLDTSFGIGGKVTTEFGGFSNFAHAVAIQGNGKIVVAGTTYTNFFKFGIARYNNDGSLDTTFGNGGKIITSFSFLDDQCFALALQTDGKIVAAGAARFFSRFGLARYNKDGSLDATFGNGGQVTTTFVDSDISFAQASAVIIQNDGKIIAAGGAVKPDTFSSDFALARYNSDGSLDASFGQAGKVTNDFFGFGDQIFAAALQNDGKIVAAGITTGGIQSDFALARYNGDGPSFDICLQDDSTGNLLQFNSTTGDYQFTRCGGSLVLGGKGSLISRGGTFTLQDYEADRRVLARVDTSVNRGTASVQIFSQATTFTITDRNTLNNTCTCR
jgi:uncharacterized delta-60 repeat protein